MKRKLYLRIQAFALVLLIMLTTFIVNPQQVQAETTVDGEEESALAENSAESQTDSEQADVETETTENADIFPESDNEASPENHDIEIPSEQASDQIDESQQAAGDVTHNSSSPEHQEDLEHTNVASETTETTDILPESDDEENSENDNVPKDESSDVADIPEIEADTESFEPAVEPTADEDINSSESLSEQALDQADESEQEEENSGQEDANEQNSDIDVTDTTKVGMSARSYTPASDFKFDPVKGEITDYIGTSTIVNIPHYINEVTVKSIRSYAFFNNDLIEVTIPNSVESIGYAAFANNKLIKVTIPDSVRIIVTEAFRNNQLTEVTISNNIEIIDERTFYNNKLMSVTIPDRVIEIKSSAFENNLLTSVTIPNNVRIIGEHAFRNNHLKSISIGRSVARIEKFAFRNNQLKYVTIPNSVTHIGEYAFSNNQLQKVTIPNSIRSIEYCSFSNNQLDSVVIPDSVTTIGERAFEKNLLTSVTIPNSVTLIGVDAFNDNLLTSVTIPNSVSKMGKNAFKNNPISSASIPNSIKELYYIFTDITNPTVEEIKEYCFDKFLEYRYIKAGSDIRSTPNGTIIETLEMPIYVSGVIEGSSFKFTHKGRTAYVSMSETTESPPPISGYTVNSVNVRVVPVENGDIIGSFPAGRKVSGTLVGNWVKLNYSGTIGYINAALLQATPVQATRYIFANSIIRSSPNGSIITRPWRPFLITGTIEGAWFKFTYNGSDAYVALSSTTTGNPVMKGYAKQTLYVRNTPNGSVTDTILRGTQVNGVLVGNMVKFTHNGNTAYVYAVLLQKNPVRSTRYVVANSIIRSTPNGSIITRPWRPFLITGTIEGAWFKFTYNGRNAYVALRSTTTGNPVITGYAKQTLYIRIQPNGAIIGRIPRGYQVRGVLVGNMVRFRYKAKNAYVYAVLLQKNPIKVTRYVKANSIIRSRPNGSIIIRPWRPVRITGTIEGAWFKFTYKGSTAYVALRSTTIGNPAITGYAKQKLYVRNTPNGSIVATLPKGYRVRGVLVGNMVRFTYRGKTSYVYATLLQKNP